MKTRAAVVCIVLFIIGGAFQSFASNSSTHGQQGRSNFISISGSNSSLAKALQNNNAWLQNNAKQNVQQLHGLLNDSNRADFSAKARRITPQATTLLGPIGVNRFDLMQGLVFNNLGKKSNLASYEYDYTQTVFHPRLHPGPTRGQDPIDYFKPAAESTNPIPVISPSRSSLVASQWDAWLTPVTAFERYDAKTDVTENASSTTLGISAGSVRHFKGYSLGFSGFFLRSAPTGGGWEADIESYGLMAALENPGFDLGPLKPRIRLGAAYSYSLIQQARQDVLGFNHKSCPEQHGIRLAASVGQNIPLLSWLSIMPTIGLDYTFIKQDAYTESGNDLRLAVRGASMHSIRPYLGGQIDFLAFENLTLTAHGLVRREVGERTLTLSSEIVGTPLTFSSQGHKYSSSSGNGGLSLAWRPSKDITISAHYDILVGDRYPGHHAQTPAAMSFDGESYDGSSGNGGLGFNWQLADSVSLNATYDAVFDGDAPQTLMNAVLTWEF